jgi:hypothetical protein
MSLLVRAVSTSELRVDQAATAFRRTSSGDAAGLSSTASALDDRLGVTDSVLELRQSSSGDRDRLC